MKNRTGNLLMLVGAVFVIMALFLFVHNEIESKKASESTEMLMSKVTEEVGSVESDGIYDLEMPQILIDEKACIGYLAIPDLGLELPVFSEWNYSNLKLAPCRYSGAVKTDDFVIAAHNYQSHFGRISKLMPGDHIYFTGMDGAVTVYSVAGMEILQPEDIEKMTKSNYDLTLFTCTYGGQERMTVRCIKNQ